jgi:hypothetical protein
MALDLQNFEILVSIQFLERIKEQKKKKKKIGTLSLSSSSFSFIEKSIQKARLG